MSTLRVDTLQSLDSAFTIDVEDIISAVSKVNPVISIAALRALTNPQTTQLIDYYGDWDVRADPTPLGGGMFDWDPDSLVADNGGTIIKLNTIATGRMVRRIAGAPTNPHWFGALGDNVHDDYAALQASINWAQDNGGAWHLPASKQHYYSSQALVQTKRLTASGDGRYQSVIESSSPSDGWLVTPPFAGASNTGYIFQDFGIVPRVANAGTYALRIGLQAAVTPAVCFFADATIQRMMLGEFNNGGLHFDNTVANTDGFFTTQVLQNTIVNGIMGTKVGDSLTFAYNKIYGKNVGIYMQGVPGARQMVLQENNITTHGGLIALLDVEEPVVKDCQLEHPGYLSGYTGALGAGVLLFNCFKPELVGNTINPDNGAATAPANPGLPVSCIALTGTTTNAHIDHNDIQKGLSFHINIGAVSVVNTFVGEFNTYYGAAGVIGDGGTGTKRILYGSASYNPPSIATGTAVGTTVPVVDSQLGMFVSVSFAQNLAGIIVTAWVLSPGTVSVQFSNFTGAPIDLAAAVLRVRVTS